MALRPVGNRRSLGVLGIGVEGGAKVVGSAVELRLHAHGAARWPGRPRRGRPPRAPGPDADARAEATVPTGTTIHCRIQ